MVIFNVITDIPFASFECHTIYAKRNHVRKNIDHMDMRFFNITQKILNSHNSGRFIIILLLLSLLLLFVFVKILCKSTDDLDKTTHTVSRKCGRLKVTFNWHIKCSFQ